MDYDILVIGGGPGGYVAAIKAAQKGKRTALVEDGQLGGICLNQGCIPTKALLKSAELLHIVKESGNFGVEIPFVDRATLNIPNVQKRKNEIVEQLVSGVKGLLKKNGVEVIEGRAALTGKNRVEVGGKEMTAENIIIATGSAPQMLTIPGMEKMKLLCSEDVLNLVDLPSEMIVVGGGVIGIEMAYYLTCVGTRVKIIEYMDRILPAVDEEIGEIAYQMLLAEGIEIYTSSQVERMEGGSVLFTYQGKERREDCDAVLMAVGRRPNTEGLFAVDIGIEMEKGAIKTNARMETSVSGIYAIGDVNGKSMLAHTASAEALVAVENICGREATVDYEKIPAVIFLNPEIASVGLTEKAAREAYGEIRIGRFPVAANGKARVEGSSDGLIKVIAEARYGEIVGAHLCCSHASDMIAEMSLALSLECTAEELVKAVHPHPTISEAIAEACHAAAGGAIHV